MNNNSRRILLLVALAAVVLLLWKNCWSGGGSGDQPFTLNIRMEAPATMLNPYLPSPGYSRYVAVRIFQTLGEIDPYSFELEPLLAKSIPTMQTVQDGPHKGELAYNFEIHPEATWDNGSPVTARDIEFSLKIIFHPNLPTQAYRGFFEQLKSIETDPSNPRKFTIYLRDFYMLALESMCGVPIYPAYHYDAQNNLTNIPLADFLDTVKVKQVAQNPAVQAFATEFQLPKYKNDPTAINGSGPYKLETMNGEQGLSLVKKQNWWGDKAVGDNSMLGAYPARIQYFVVPDETATENMLRKGELDLAVDMSPAKFRELEKDPALTDKYDFSTHWTTKYNRWIFNLNHPILKDSLVRQALVRLVDYDDIVNNILLGLGQRLVGPVNPRKSYYAKDVALYNFNVEEARRILAAAGWTDTNNNGTLDKVIGGTRTELEFQMLATPTPKVAELVAASLVQSLAKGGVKINLVTASIREISEKTRSGNYDSAIFGAAQNPGLAELYQNYHSASLVSLGGDNRSPFMNAAFDRTLSFIRTTQDTTARTRAYMDAQRILHDESPEAFLYSSDFRYIVAKKYDYVISGNRPGYYEHLFRLK